MTITFSASRPIAFNITAMKLARRMSLLILFLVVMNGCGDHTSIQTQENKKANNVNIELDKKRAAEIGRQLFHDKTLSASGQQSCASCHDPAFAYGPNNALSVQLGGAHLDQQGTRAVPSLRYVLDRTPAWHIPYVRSLGERIREGIESPSGGFTWDGRVNTLHEQAAFPLMAANEMANTSIEDIVKKIAVAPYAHQFQAVFGTDIFNTPQKAYQDALMAIEQFEISDESFHPFTSKYDVFLDGKATLNDAELRGLRLFNDPNKGNCASCHSNNLGQDGSHPLLTNFQYEALGVPRNHNIKANDDPHFYDKGVCGPIRKDLTDNDNLCGFFKTPTLRNVASRAVFFHNGYFHSLKEALEFYVQRDTNPEKWYPTTKNHVTSFDDLPPAQRGNVNTIDLPMNNTRGGKPIWTEKDIDDVVAFLKTLTDRDVMNR